MVDFAMLHDLWLGIEKKVSELDSFKYVRIVSMY